MNFLLHRKIAICMLFIALTGLGYVSYKQLPVELLPNAELPMLFVQVTSAQDMDPSYVESEVVIPIEGFRCLPVASCRSRCVDRVVRTGFVT